MAPESVRYIPAGTLEIIAEDRQLIRDAWGSDDVDGSQWKWLAFQDEDGEKSGQLDGGTVEDGLVSIDFGLDMFKTDELMPVRRLLRAGWIRVQVLLANDSGWLRVHLLPDDKLRGKIDRSQGLLLKSRQTVLRTLDYSDEAWDAEARPTTSTFAPFEEQMTDESEDESLLAIFNRIPSPKPDPSVVCSPEARMCMHGLLNSKVDGLRSTLYSYQRQSAALMLQKETQPGTIIDPRLRCVKDRQGDTWYIDPVAGSVLSEARHYDDVPGGILAEEMGSGKTVICLALILATRLMPMAGPDIHGVPEPRKRRKVGSLMDMAASAANRNGVPWRYLMSQYRTETGIDDQNIIKTLDALENYGYYNIPAPELRRCGRRPSKTLDRPPKKIYLSGGSIIIVPNNLLYQWRDEISLHTHGLKVLTLSMSDPIPAAHSLPQYDVLLFAQNRFEAEFRFDNGADSPLLNVHFRRCIVDEGHKLGSSRMHSRSILLAGLDALHVSARWVVTGTPSHGLFGTKNDESSAQTSLSPEPLSLGTDKTPTKTKGRHLTSHDMEKKDLDRIGSIATLYLKARPWANTVLDAVDTTASWNTYLKLPKHGGRGQGHQQCLRLTLNSLIIRHRIEEVGELLPPVHEKVVVLDGSWYDQLSLNIFSMMIVFNAVQSQRTDQDYFFHHKQRPSLLQIVKNLKMSTFFGGSFFTTAEIQKSVETAEEFLREGKVKMSPEDKAMLEDAMNLGRLATTDALRNLSNQYHEMPVSVSGFPGLGSGSSWGFGGGDQDNGDAISTISSLLLSLQKTIHSVIDKPEEFNALLNGGLARKGHEQKQQIGQMVEEEFSGTRDKTLAGNTKLGDDHVWKARMHGVNNIKPKEVLSSALEPTKITATVSAKLSYLLDSVVMHQEQEKMLIFYEHENAAFYLSGMLDVLQIQHLIYAKGITSKRRAQYISSFHDNPVFRVLLMDLSQAAFGLDMREASRIYFLSPVLNPQVEAQAIGRLRRIRQKKPVYVETLVLKDSIDEVILERKEHMSQAEHVLAKSILDIPSIYNWIKNAKIRPMPTGCHDDVSKMSPLEQTHHVFGRGFGRTSHPDEGLVPSSPTEQRQRGLGQAVNDQEKEARLPRGEKRTREASDEGLDRPTAMRKLVTVR